MRLFLDTNILLDYMLRREGWENAARIVAMSRKGYIKCYCSYLSMADIAHICRREYGPQKIREIIKDHMSWCEVLAPGSLDIYDATKLDHPDFEDSLQILTAELNGVNAIITNNTRHFAAYTEIPVYTSAELIALTAGQKAN